MKNEIILIPISWMDPEIVILSEISQRQTSDDITWTWTLKKGYKRTH